MGESFGCLPFRLPLAFATATPSLVRSRMRSHSNAAKVGRILKTIVPIAIGRVVHGGAQLQVHAPLHRTIGNAAGVRHRAGRAIKLRHHQGVDGADRSQRLVEAGPQAIGACDAVVAVDPICCNTEFQSCFALDSQALLVSRTACVANDDPDCGPSRTFSEPLLQIKRDEHFGSIAGPESRAGQG